MYKLSCRPFLYEVQSRSDPQCWYRVYFDGETGCCDCAGFTYRAWCRHLTLIKYVAHREGSMPLEEKNRLILEKVFMAFGSLMKAHDKTLLDADQLEKYADRAWQWSVRNVGQLINQAYDREAKRRAETEGAPNGTEPSPASTPAPKPAESDALRGLMTPKSVEFSGEGEYRNGGKWKRYRITDTMNVYWSAFNMVPEIGVKYDVEYLLDDKGRRTIKKLVEVADKQVHEEPDDIEDDSEIPF